MPRAWGAGGQALADGANLALAYPETAVVTKHSLTDQTRELAAALPERPIVLGGCCCAHVGAVQGLAGRMDRIAVVWIDAHGDLNTPETSPSGNLWGMPLRMLLDDGVIAAKDVALVGARSLDAPEQDYLDEAGIDDSLGRALGRAAAVYVALDLDVLDPADVEVFVPEPDGPPIEEVEAVLRDAVSRAPLAGIGVTGHVRHEKNIPIVSRLLTAAGL